MQIRAMTPEDWPAVQTISEEDIATGHAESSVRMKSAAKIVISVLTAALAIACKHTGTEPLPPPPVARIEVSPVDTLIDVEDAFVVHVMAYDSTGAVLTEYQLTTASDQPDVASAEVSQGEASAQVTVAANAVGTAVVTISVPNAGVAAPVSQTIHIRVRPKIELLDLPDGYTYVEVFDVNDAGVVVGQVGSQPRAWTYSPTGGSRLLPVLSQVYGTSQARGVNNAGIIAGYAYDDQTRAHLVVWNTQDQVSDKGMLGYSLSIGDAINASGQIALYRDVTTPAYGNHAAIYDTDGSVTDLGEGFGEPADIAADGAIVGGIRTGSTTELRAFLWTQDQGLHIIPPFEVISAARGVANGGRVVGWFDSGGGLGYHGFYWSVADGWNEIDPLDGYMDASAESIDEQGQVVGFSASVAGQRAFLWTKANGLVDLGDRLEGSSRANAISPGGNVIAGTVGDGSTRPVLWILKRLSH